MRKTQMNDLQTLTAILNEMVDNVNVIRFPEKRKLRSWLEKASKESFNALKQNSEFNRLLMQYAEHLKKMVKGESIGNLKPIIKHKTDAVGMYSIHISFDNKLFNGMEFALFYRDGINFEKQKPFVIVIISDDFTIFLYNNRKYERNFNTFDKNLEKEGKAILYKIRAVLLKTYIEQFKEVLPNPPKIDITHKYFSLSNVIIPAEYTVYKEL